MTAHTSLPPIPTLYRVSEWANQHDCVLAVGEAAAAQYAALDQEDTRYDLRVLTPTARLRTWVARGATVAGCIQGSREMPAVYAAGHNTGNWCDAVAVSLLPDAASRARHHQRTGSHPATQRRLYPSERAYLTAYLATR